MDGPCIISALRDKRSEVSALVRSFEQQLSSHRAILTHLDATILLFAPDLIVPAMSVASLQRPPGLFQRGECIRLIYDGLRDAAHPLTARDLVERIAQTKSIAVTDERQRLLLHKAVLNCLTRAKETIERIEDGSVVRWQIRQAARARCQ